MRLSEVIVGVLISAMIFTSGLFCYGACIKSAERIKATERRLVLTIQEKAQNVIDEN